MTRRNPYDQGKGFIPPPKRWVVEQVNGTLMLHRRLAHDYDLRPDNAASRVYWVSTAGVLRRLTTPSPAWRDDVEPAACTSPDPCGCCRPNTTRPPYAPNSLRE